MIAEKGKWLLLGSDGVWDTNYHLIDTTTNVDYLLDISDVNDEVSCDELTNLTDPGKLASLSWKTRDFKKDGRALHYYLKGLGV